MSDLSRIPLTALSNETKHVISTLLNPPKVIPSGNGLFRDWRGLAQVCFIGGEVLPAIAFDPDPSNKIFTIVQKQSKHFTLENLKNALEQIERWDIIDDSEIYLEKDAEAYITRLKHSQDCAEENNFSKDADILTLDDQIRVERGEEKQHYDAFILYAEEDMDFVNELVETLEKNNNLKLCLKDRDLIAGISFEHEAIMRLISERCNRLIPIISPDFLKSPANKFFLNFAQANGIDKKQERKIIPCVYKNCDLPPQLTYFSKIFYKNLAPEFFWDKLILSMKAVSDISYAQKSTVIPDEDLSIINDKENEYVKTSCEENQDIKENSSGESSKSVESIQNRSFSWLKKLQTLMIDKLSKPNEVFEASETIPSLPSLDGLDSFSSITDSENQTKKHKRNKMFFKKVQSLLAKS